MLRRLVRCGALVCNAFCACSMWPRCGCLLLDAVGSHASLTPDQLGIAQTRLWQTPCLAELWGMPSSGKAYQARGLGLLCLMHILQCLPHPICSSELVCSSALGSVSMSAVSMNVDKAKQLTHGQVDIGLQLHAPTGTLNLDRKAVEAQQPGSPEDPTWHIRLLL